MKKVIEKKIYNTETAQEIANYSYSNHSDFNYIDETLYVTKKGNFFLHGKGGAASRYAKSDGNMSYGSSEIIAMTEDEAYHWLEENGMTEEIETYFSSRIEEA